MQVTTQMIKELRERTGAGVVDCKNMLVETEGDVDKAVVELQKKGLAKAAKKAGRIAAEGVVQAYVHPGSRIGVLLEVNCETDFVARNEDFLAFVEDVSMQVAAMNPQFVQSDDIDDTAKAQQKEIFIGQAKESGKPDHIAEKMVEGRLAKWAKEICLYDQPFIKETDKTINEIRQALVAKTGENIAVRRFVRYELGEGLEKRSNDLAAEVAAEMAKYEK